MDNVVYLDKKAKELDNLISGTKNMIIRGAMGRKIPYDRVIIGDILYFIENNGDGMVRSKAKVSDIYQSDKLSKEDSVQLVQKHQDNLLLDNGLFKRFAGKRYLILITITDFKQLEPFKIDRSQYGNMDDWLPVEDIKNVMI